jgi:hypothetical protein
MSRIDRQTKNSPGLMMTRPQLDLAGFRGRWVAIDSKSYEVIGQGGSLEEARRSAPNIEQREPLLYYVPESDAFFVGRGT